VDQGEGEYATWDEELEEATKYTAPLPSIEERPPTPSTLKGKTIVCRPPHEHNIIITADQLE